MDGLIYVLGGENEDTEVLLTMEVFDPHLNNWTTQTSMTTVRKVSERKTSVYSVMQCTDLISVRQTHARSVLQFGCCAAMKKKLYIMGGGSYGKIFDSVECYDPKTQQWTTLCPLKERR